MACRSLHGFGCLLVRNGFRRPSPAAAWCALQLPGSKAPLRRPWDHPQRCSSTAAASAGKPLVMMYKDGTYRFSLEVNGPVAFSFTPATTLGAILDSVKSETGDRQQPVTLSTSDGAPLAADITIGDAMRAEEGVRVNVGQTQHTVVLARSMGLYDPEVEGHTELPSLLEKARMLELRAHLEEDARRSMPFTEFTALCESCGIPEEEAPAVAAALHRVGAVLHFGKVPELAGSVYLKPDEVLEDLFSRYNLNSPLLQYLARRVAQLDKQAQAVEDVLSPMNALQRALDERAAASAGRYIWGLTSGILAGAGGYWYLVYVHFSWDIMEPVTFFTGLGVSTIGYAWWMATNRQYEYGNVYHFFLQRAKNKFYKHGGLNLVELARLNTQLAEIREKQADVTARKLQLEVMRDAKPVTSIEDVYY